MSDHDNEDTFYSRNQTERVTKRYFSPNQDKIADNWAKKAFHETGEKAGSISLSLGSDHSNRGPTKKITTDKRTRAYESLPKTNQSKEGKIQC